MPADPIRLYLPAVLGGGRMTAMNSDVLTRIRQRLTDAGIAFREVAHEPTLTSEASAAARGEPLGVGAKALLLRTEETFRLFVLPADCKLDSAAVKRELGIKKLRFATAEELLGMTGLAPGSRLTAAESSLQSAGRTNRR